MNKQGRNPILKHLGKHDVGYTEAKNPTKNNNILCYIYGFGFYDPFDLIADVITIKYPEEN